MENHTIRAQGIKPILRSQTLSAKYMFPILEHPEASAEFAGMGKKINPLIYLNGASERVL